MLGDYGAVARLGPLGVRHVCTMSAGTSTTFVQLTLGPVDFRAAITPMSNLGSPNPTRDAMQERSISAALDLAPQIGYKM